MERSRRRLPSPALVVACLALFVALGGTVLAATKIDGRKIKVKSLPGNRLEPGSVPGNRIAADSLKGEQIDADTLGQVPEATHADSATEARRSQTAVAADHATDASTINGRAVGCGEGQRQFAGACWDVAANAAAETALEAAAECASKGGELPPALGLKLFIEQPGVQLSVEGEWTNEVTAPNNAYFGVLVLPQGGVFEVRPSDEKRQFRCVTPLLH